MSTPTREPGQLQIAEGSPQENLIGNISRN